MFSLSLKIMKPHGKRLDKFKSGIYQALHELERNWDPRAHLRELNATAAKEIEVGGGWKVLISFVPIPELKSFQKIQIQLVCELEEKVQWEACYLYCSENSALANLRKAIQRMNTSIPGSTL